MDIYDRATEAEERDRARCLHVALSAPVRDYEWEISAGCSYATKSNYGKSCEAWAECLQDMQKRERAAR